MSDARITRLAARAYKLSREGLTPKPIGERLKVTTAEATDLIRLGRAQANLDEVRRTTFTEPELRLLRALAAIQRDDYASGYNGMAITKRISWRAGKARGWAAAVAGKRLRTERHYDARSEEPPLGLVYVAGNGHMALTKLGWMVVNAIEAAAEDHR